MTILIATLVGLLMGSFLNVVIVRLPKILEAQWQKNSKPHHMPILDPSDISENEFRSVARTCSKGELISGGSRNRFNLIYPRSHCLSCQNIIAWWQNIPVLSYLLLRGKCFYCHDKISLRYPIIELLTACLSGYLAWHFGYGLPLLGSLLFTWMLITCFFIDMDHQLLPDHLTLPLLWLGLLFNLNHTFALLNDAVIGAVAGYLFFWVIYWLFKLITKKEGLGYGDFKLLAALGAWLGWQYLPMVILLSAVLSVIIALALKVLSRRHLQKAMAYGPALAIGGWVALLWGHSILMTYLHWALHG